MGFVGAGMMATALMDGLVSKRVVDGPSSVTCSDVWEPARARAAAAGYRAVSDNADVCRVARDVVVIAVKPHVVADACREITESDDGHDALVVSVAAGVTLSALRAALPGRRVVRVMPNTPCAVGAAACGYAAGDECSDADKRTVEALFGAVGLCLEVPSETHLDAVTGLSGSGPAYVFQFVEALSDGGVKAGLPRALATRLAAQTVMGAAKMVLDTARHPGELKDAVTSPGGTTIAGVEALERGGLRAATMAAVAAATKRSMQLGGTSDEVIRNKHGL